MENIKIEKISLLTYLKLNFIGAFGFGIIIGLIGFVMSLINPGSVNLTVGYETITGIAAGAGGIIAFPVILGVIYTFFSLFFYLGILLYLYLRKTIEVKVKIQK